MATTLPSFVELMESLGLDQAPAPAHQRSAPASPRSSPSASPQMPSVIPPSPTKSRSNPSLRDTAASRTRLARYSPYSPVFNLSSRRSSLSSVSSSSSDYERPTIRAYSTSPHPPSSPRARKRHGNNLTVNVYGSNSDLAANPISTYVRRKTPGASPTSPTFPREVQDSPSASPMPFSIPTLPALFPRSASSESFPITPNSDVEHLPSDNSPNYNTKSLPDVEGTFIHRAYHTGVRISSPPMSADLGIGRYSRTRTVQIAQP